VSGFLIFFFCSLGFKGLFLVDCFFFFFFFFFFLLWLVLYLGGFFVVFCVLGLVCGFVLCLGIAIE